MDGVYTEEILGALNEENQDFILDFWHLIPEIIEQFPCRTKDMSGSRKAHVIGQLIRELAICYKMYSGYHDGWVTTLCVRLRVQKRFLEISRDRKPLAPVERVA